MAKTTTSKPTPKTSRAQNRGSAVARSTRSQAMQRGGRLGTFFREVRVEMGKVTWPERDELLQSTMVVLVACIIAAVYIGLWDLVWATLVDLARLG